MSAVERRNPWLEIVLLGAVSAILHQTGIFLVFFAIPVQVVAVRRGSTAFLNAAMVSLGIIALWKGVQIMSIAVPDGDTTLIMLDILLPFSIFLALGMLSLLPKKGVWQNVWWRIAAACALAVLCVFPMLMYARVSPLFQSVIEAQYQFLLDQGMLVEDISLQDLQKQVVSMLFQGIGGGISLLVCLNYYFGASLGGDRQRLRQLVLPRWTVGLAIGLFAAGMFKVNGLLAVFVWNVFGFLAVLYSFVGVAVFAQVMSRKKTGPRKRLLWMGGIILLLLIPIVNITVLLLLPITGAVDTVVRIRERYRNKGVTDESHFEH